VLAYVVAWALFAFQRLLLWEIAFMPAKFVWFRAAVSTPLPLALPPSPWLSVSLAADPLGRCYVII
jgi:hypothetical protein